MPDPMSPPLSGPDRRTILTGAAWTVPAIVAMSTSPAHAAGSNSPYITVTTPNQQIIATGDTTVTAIVTTSAGAPSTGQPVSFTAPAGATLTPSTATTDSNGQATTKVNLGTPWRTPGSTVTVTAISGGQSTSQALTVLGGNALATGRWAVPGDRNLLFTQIELAFPSPIVQIASSSLVLLKNGTVWTRGGNGFGQLGNGTTNSRFTWGVVPQLTDVKQVATGGENANFALRQDGTVWAWGYNGSGQLGLGDTTNRTVPTQVTALTGATQIAARGTTTYARTGDRAWGWGSNSQGQTGSGQASSTPMQIIASGVGHIAPNDNRCAALMTDGSVRIWGASYTSTPQVFGGVSGVTQLAAAQSTYYAILTDGSAVSWGSNNEGQGGNGDTTSSMTTARPIVGLSSGARKLWGSGESGGGTSGSGYAWLTDGSLRSWGTNDAGQLGDGANPSPQNNRSSPVTPALPSGTPPVVAVSDTVGSIGAVIVKAD